METDNKPLVKLILQKKPSLLSKKNKAGFTAASVAVVAGHSQSLEAMLEHGMYPNHSGPFGNTALITAAEKGRFQIVSTLIKCKADILIKYVHEKTAIEVAAAYGEIAIIEELTRHGCDIRSILGKTLNKLEQQQASKKLSSSMFAEKLECLLELSGPFWSSDFAKPFLAELATNGQWQQSLLRCLANKNGLYLDNLVKALLASLDPTNPFCHQILQKRLRHLLHRLKLPAPP